MPIWEVAEPDLRAVACDAMFEQGNLITFSDPRDGAVADGVVVRTAFPEYEPRDNHRPTALWVRREDGTTAYVPLDRIAPTSR